LLRFFGRRRTHDRRGDLFAPVEVVELVVFDNFDEQFGISRIGRIASLFESVSPPFVIHRVQFEQVLVTGRFVEEFRMVVERGLDGRVFAETFAFRIVVVRDRGTGPGAFAFDAEVVVAFARQAPVAVVRFEQRLGHRDAGGDAVYFHLFDGQRLIFLDVFFAGEAVLSVCGEGEQRHAQRQQGNGIRFHTGTFMRFGRHSDKNNILLEFEQNSLAL